MTATCPFCKLQATYNKHLQEKNIEKIRPRAASGLPANLERANVQVEGLRKLRKELGRIIGEDGGLTRPVPDNEILPWVRRAVAIAREHGLFEQKAAVQAEARKGDRS